MSVLENDSSMVMCARCGEKKEVSKFYKRKNGKPLSYCQDCQKDVKKLKLQENMERIIEERGGNCADCNGIFPAELYEFHKNGETFQISKAKNMSITKIKQELTDYVMLCRNCNGLRKWAGN